MKNFCVKRQFKGIISTMLMMGVIAMIALTLQSCGSDVRDQFDTVEELLRVNPDSSYRIMKAIDPRNLHSEEDKALYALRKVQADYFSDQPVWIDDSLINLSLDYYRKNPETPEAAQAFYMAGLANVEHDNCRLAIENFTDAIISADSIGDILTSAKSHCELSDIYYSSDMLLLYLKHCREYYEKIQNYNGPRATGYRNFALTKIASAYYNINVWDSAFKYMDIGLKSIDSKEYPDNYYYLLRLKAKALTYLDKSEEAFRLFDRLQREYPELLDKNSLLYIGYLHLKFDNIKKAEEFDSILISKYGKSYVLAAYIANVKGETGKAFELMTKQYLDESDRSLSIATDSLNTDNDVFARLKGRRQLAKKEKEHKYVIRAGGVLAILLFLGLAYFIYLWIRRTLAVKNMAETIENLSEDLANKQQEVSALSKELLKVSFDSVSSYVDKITEDSIRLTSRNNGGKMSRSRIMELTLENFRNDESLQRLEEIADRKTDGLVTLFKQTETSKLFHMTEALVFVILGYKPKIVANYLQTESIKISRYRNQLKTRLRKENPELFARLSHFIPDWESPDR